MPITRVWHYVDASANRITLLRLLQTTIVVLYFEHAKRFFSLFENLLFLEHYLTLILLVSHLQIIMLGIFSQTLWAETRLRFVIFWSFFSQKDWRCFLGHQWILGWGTRMTGIFGALLEMQPIAKLGLLTNLLLALAQLILPTLHLESATFFGWSKSGSVWGCRRLFCGRYWSILSHGARLAWKDQIGGVGIIWGVKLRFLDVLRILLAYLQRLR